jgi:hypothetical protein
MRRTTSAYEYGSNGAQSPTTQPDGESTRSAGLLPPMQLGDSISTATGIPVADGSYPPMALTPEETERLRLVREIEDTKKSIDALRTSTAPSSVILADRPTSSAAPFDNARSRRQSGMSHGSRLSAYHADPASPLGPATPDDPRAREWQEYLTDRKLFTPPSGVTPPIESSIGRLSKIPDAVVEAMNRRERTVSAYELGANPVMEADHPSTLAEPRSGATTPYTRRPASLDLLVAPPPARPAVSATLPRPQSGYRVPPIVTGHADSHLLRKSSEARVLPEDAHRSSITFEELGARHRARLSKLQQPITQEMQSSLELAEAKARYDKNREAEKRAAARKAAESAARPRQISPTQHQGEPQKPTARGPESSVLANIPQESGMAKAAQWTRRQSSMQLDRAAVALESPVGTAGDRSARPRGQGEAGRDRPVPRQRYSSGPNKVVN